MLSTPICWLSREHLPIMIPKPGPYVGWRFDLSFFQSSILWLYKTQGLCCILTLDQAVNQRCTCVNKRKKKRKQVGVMKECWQMPAAVESVRGRKASPLADWERPVSAVALSDSQLSNTSQDVEEVLSGFLKITQRAMAKRRSWVNIAVCPCLHPSLRHHRNINPFENKVWEIYFYKEVCSFVHWSS